MRNAVGLGAQTEIWEEVDWHHRRRLVDARSRSGPLSGILGASNRKCDVLPNCVKSLSLFARRSGSELS